MKLGVPIVFGDLVDPAVVLPVVFPGRFGDFHGEAMGEGPFAVLGAVAFIMLGAFLSAGFAEVFFVVHHPVVEFMAGGALVAFAEVSLFWGEAGDTSPFDDKDVAFSEADVGVDDR